MYFVFQVDDLLLIEEKIDLEVRSLETCMYEHKTFTEILNRVQKAVDDLNLHSYSNLPIWVNKLDIEVCANPYNTLQCTFCVVLGLLPCVLLFTFLRKFLFKTALPSEYSNYKLALIFMVLRAG